MWEVKRASPFDVGAAKEEAPNTKVAVIPPKETVARSDDMLQLKVRIHRQLLERLNLAALDTLPREQIASEVGQVVTELLSIDGTALNRSERETLIEDVLDELIGLGPLEPLLEDPSITDILVNGYETVFVERHGLLERVGTRFQDERHLLRIIQRIVSAVGRRIDESSPFVDARLADGSRVNAIVAPLAIDGSLLSIRKFSKIPISMEKMIELGSVPAKVAKVLKAVVEGRLNIIISGGTGSGKTTLLNALSSYIDHRERIVTIEDSAELQLQQEHVARLETRPANIEGRGEVTQRDLVKNALRMRPDRIILGECRAGEAFDMLQAMNTGHDGSMTTVHAKVFKKAGTKGEQRRNIAITHELYDLILFMTNSFIRPTDIKVLQHKHVAVIRGDQTYLRLTHPPTKSHGSPVVTMPEAVEIYDRLLERQRKEGFGKPDDYLFQPEHRENRDYALRTITRQFDQLLTIANLKKTASGESRTLYSLRHTCIMFRLTKGDNVALLTLARSARTSTEMIDRFYAKHLHAEMNVQQLQSMREGAKGRKARKSPDIAEKRETSAKKAKKGV